jgi:hypothetical protein
MVECPKGSGDYMNLSGASLRAGGAGYRTSPAPPVPSLPKAVLLSKAGLHLSLLQSRRLTSPPHIPSPSLSRRRGDPAPADPHLCQGRGGQPGLQRRQPHAQPRPPLQGLHAIPRVLQRQRRPRSRSVAPNRMDRSCRLHDHAVGPLVPRPQDATHSAFDRDALLRGGTSSDAFRRPECFC